MFCSQPQKSAKEITDPFVFHPNDWLSFLIFSSSHPLPNCMEIKCGDIRQKTLHKGHTLNAFITAAFKGKI